jgi:hypothetical protein
MIFRSAIILPVKIYRAYTWERGNVMKTNIFACLIPLFMAVCLFSFTACAENNAEDLFKTAQFEELQNNREHAEILYKEILANYPDSEYSKKAEKRLSELNDK